MLKCIVGSRHTLMIKRKRCRGSIGCTRWSCELGELIVKAPPDEDRAESPYCELDTVEDDSWLNDDRVKTYGETIQGILNALSVCINEQEELSKLWSNLNNVITAGRAMAQGLDFLEQWN